AAEVVDLDGVERPVGELVGVALVVASAAAEAALPGDVGAGVGVDAGLEALGVDVLDEAGHAVGELGRVGSESAGRAARGGGGPAGGGGGGPVGVDRGVGVAGVTQATADEEVGGGFDLFLGGVAT